MFLRKVVLKAEIKVTIISGKKKLQKITQILFFIQGNGSLGARAIAQPVE